MAATIVGVTPSALHQEIESAEQLALSALGIIEHGEPERVRDLLHPLLEQIHSRLESASSTSMLLQHPSLAQASRREAGETVPELVHVNG